MKKIRNAKYSRDVELVKKHAKCCIILTPNGVEVIENEKYSLEIVAVIGPCTVNLNYGSKERRKINQLSYLDEGVLLEVGLKRSKPYSEANGLKKKIVGMPSMFPERYGHLQPTEEQYRLFAPYLFKYLNDYATERILFQMLGWHDPFKLRVNVGAYRNRFTNEIKDTKNYVRPPSVRFAISAHDSYIVGDVYWAELFGRANIQTQLDKVVRWMHGGFGRHKLKGRKRIPKNWMSLYGFSSAIGALRRLPDYQQLFIWKEHFGIHHSLHYEIMEQIGYQGYDPWEEKVRNLSLSGQKERVGSYSMKVIRRTEKYVVFDFFPPEPEVEEGIDMEDF